MNHETKPSTLERTAPALFHALRRGLSPGAVAGLVSLFEEVFRRIGPEDPAVVRPEGASYNPRPARVCRLLLDEFGPDIEALGSTAVTLLPPAAASDFHGFECVNPGIVQGAHVRLQGGREPIPPAGEAIALAVALDEIRHLHMTNLDSGAKRSVVERAQAILTTAPAIPQLSRLASLLRHAIVRFESGRTDG